ncbi:dephospho-CoA kinase [Kordiimonas sp. SCSIO 12610]|uniref:dephospho-CoA kinase n=1 Tax=Kordiimonas sp. SCSIO 12610 TaxID=2829597 RepID=UPI00210D7532|nr:dephospho-CoA kinase [Kordiimonas sp. SCSIO 12610]UTW55468.1 dephospho-CoA kinase [Kordiimonas sp. SCSIO 12610]
MIIVGLTGSIGMGKSATADMFRGFDIPVFDADAAVHKLQSKNGRAIPLIEETFPGVVDDGVLDRAMLGQMVFADKAALKKLEAIMHPMVQEDRIAFFEQATKENKNIVVVDIPLLFETGGEKACDKVVVVSAPYEVQRNRVLERVGMTPDKFEDILSKQTPDAIKREKADFIVETDKGFDHARLQVQKIIETLSE